MKEKTEKKEIIEEEGKRKQKTQKGENNAPRANDEENKYTHITQPIYAQ